MNNTNGLLIKTLQKPIYQPNDIMIILDCKKTKAGELIRAIQNEYLKFYKDHIKAYKRMNIKSEHFFNYFGYKNAMEYFDNCIIKRFD